MLKDRQLDRMPSDYMRERFPASFITDPYAVVNRHYVGVERMLWSSDYPHITTDWPCSWRTINSTFLGVPADERHAILAGNAMPAVALAPDPSSRVTRKASRGWPRRSQSCRGGRRRATP